MVDQSYIEEIKRRNAERAAKLKKSLKIGDFSKLAPSGVGAEPLEDVQVSPAVLRAAGPPPPPTSKPVFAGPSPPPPPGGEAASTVLPPPVSFRPRTKLPPPPSFRAEEPAVPTAPPEEVEEPVIPTEGIWDEILGEMVEAAPEGMPSPLDTGPSTSELEQFKVPLFDTSKVEEQKEMVTAAVSRDQDEGVTDEFTVPTFDSGPTGETTPVVEEEEVKEESVVPYFDSAPVEAVETAAEPEEEFVVPAFDSSMPGPVEAVEATEEIYAVPVPASALSEASPAVEEPVEEAPAAEPVFTAPASVAENFIILEVDGTELRLRRRNISLREAISIFEVAAEECRKLIEE